MVSAMNGKKELKHQRLINVGKKKPTVIIFVKPLFIVVSGVKRLFLLAICLCRKKLIVENTFLIAFTVKAEIIAFH